jgi:hypothetical protein
MTLTEFIAELESAFPTYAKDIDKITVKTDVIGRLKIFGNNIAELRETVLKVENSRAILPEDFKSLRLALKVESKGCNSKSQNTTESYIYKERIENPAWYDEINQEYVTSCDSKIITEKITIGNENVEFYYDYEWLSLVKGIKKDTISSECLNLHPSIRDAYKNEINITGNTINTNFREGKIYVQYYGLPTEDGEIIIPEITTGDILQYIKQYVKVEIAEKLIANNLNPQGIAQLYPNWKAELPILKAAALREAKFFNFKNWGKKFKTLNRRDIAVYNLPKFRF